MLELELLMIDFQDSFMCALKEGMLLRSLRYRGQKFILDGKLRDVLLFLDNSELLLHCDWVSELVGNNY